MVGKEAATGQTPSILVSVETFSPHRDIGIARVLQHPSGNKRTLAHDIALLALASKVEFRPGVVPACMPDNYQGRCGEQGKLVSSCTKVV